MDAILETMYEVFKSGKGLSLQGFGGFYLDRRPAGTVFKLTPGQKLRVVFLERADKSDRSIRDRLCVMEKENVSLTLRPPLLVCFRFKDVRTPWVSSAHFSSQVTIAAYGSPTFSLGPRRDAKQEHFSQRPHPSSHSRRSRRRAGLPPFGRAIPLSRLELGQGHA